MRIHLEPGNLITFVVGLGILASGAYGHFHMGRFLDRALETTAQVVEISYESTNRKGRTHPRVRFTTAAGKEVVVQSKEHHNVQRGQYVTLIYAPDNPADIEITTLSAANKRRALFTTLSIAFGLGVCALGLAFDVGSPPRPT
jgi:hypothetical protein